LSWRKEPNIHMNLYITCPKGSLSSFESTLITPCGKDRFVNQQAQRACPSYSLLKRRATFAYTLTIGRSTV
jgi:hypothetical protein